MELSSIHHIESEKLADFQADLFVSTLSHESRCIAIAKMLEDVTCRKVALSSADQLNDFAYKENLDYYNLHGFEVMPLHHEIPDIGQIMYGIDSKEARVIFDCTSMSQRWYYEFFSWFAESQNRFENVTLRFVYTLAGYVNDDSPRKVKKVKEFLKIESRKKKVKKALILGLGHEAKVSESIYKIEKPDLVYLYYADPPVDKRFVDQVFVNNHALINLTPIRNLIAYPINNGQAIYQSLMDTILPIRNEYSITLIPQGPKIFSVASMLVQIGYPDIMISYPVFKKTQVSDRQPCGAPVVLDVYFEEED